MLFLGVRCTLTIEMWKAELELVGPVLARLSLVREGARAWLVGGLNAQTITFLSIHNNNLRRTSHRIYDAFGLRLTSAHDSSGNGWVRYNTEWRV